MPLENNAIGEKLLFIEVTYSANSVIVSLSLQKEQIKTHLPSC